MRKLYITTLSTILLFLCSCSRDERIEDNSRLRFKGQLIDTEGLAISDLLIEVKTDRSELGSAFADENGNFQFNALGVKNNSLLLTVNDSRVGIESNLDFGFVRFLEVRSSGERNFDFDEITIARRANFKLVTIPQTGTTNTLTYQISYTSPNCILNLNPPSDPLPGSIEDDCFSVRDILDSKGPEVFRDSLTIDTSLNSDVLLTYRINSGVQNQVVIPVDTKFTRYELAY